MKKWMRKWLLEEVNAGILTLTGFLAKIHGTQDKANRELEVLTKRIQTLAIVIDEQEATLLDRLAFLENSKLYELQNNVERLFRWKQIASTPLWATAQQAVKKVAANRELHEAAQSEPHVSFCPRCGQTPDGDRRMEEARELVMTQFPDEKRSNVDFAIAAHYWLLKNAL